MFCCLLKTGFFSVGDLGFGLTTKVGCMFLKIQVNSQLNLFILDLFHSKSLIHVSLLHSTGEFVKQNGLETGDFLTLYEDESKNLVSLSSLLLTAMILVI
jgi:hypothetical protein